MTVTIMVTDTYLRFRLAVIEQSSRNPQTWEQEVMTLVEVARILVSLGFLDPEAGDRLVAASTTITPQEGLDTVPFGHLISLIELAHPEDDPLNVEAALQQGHVLVAKGETTEEALAAAGFALNVHGPLQ